LNVNLNIYYSSYLKHADVNVANSLIDCFFQSLSVYSHPGLNLVSFDDSKYLHLF